MSETPTEPIVDTVFTPLLDEVLACLCERLERTLGGVPCACEKVPGALVPMDYCGCGAGGCGMGWVQLQTAFPFKVFPQPVNDPRNCALPFAARLAIGTFRCAPMPDSDGNPPSVEAMNEAVDVQMSDMAALLEVARCCLPGHQRVLGSYTPVGPAADCMGGLWTFTIEV